MFLPQPNIPFANVDQSATSWAFQFPMREDHYRDRLGFNCSIRWVNIGVQDQRLPSSKYISNHIKLVYRHITYYNIIYQQFPTTMIYHENIKTIYHWSSLHMSVIVYWIYYLFIYMWGGSWHGGTPKSIYRWTFPRRYPYFMKPSCIFQ